MQKKEDTKHQETESPSSADDTKTKDATSKNKVINSDDYYDSRNFQKPSILYICGGSIASSSYFEELAEWRHRQGYVVNVVSLSEAGSTTTNIKNKQIIDPIHFFNDKLSSTAKIDFRSR